jgi:hypothetical protein
MTGTIKNVFYVFLLLINQAKFWESLRQIEICIFLLELTSSKTVYVIE